MITIHPWLSVLDAGSAIDFYRDAFGAVTGEVAEYDGVIQVAELFVGDASFWVQRDGDLPDGIEPGRTVRSIFMVDDPRAAFARALQAGATELAAVHDEHGWQTGRLGDPFGHQWEFARRTDG